MVETRVEIFRQKNISRNMIQEISRDGHFISPNNIKKRNAKRNFARKHFLGNPTVVTYLACLVDCGFAVW